jgi:hypothetical protein
MRTKDQKLPVAQFDRFRQQRDVAAVIVVVDEERPAIDPSRNHVIPLAWNLLALRASHTPTRAQGERIRPV